MKIKVQSINQSTFPYIKETFSALKDQKLLKICYILFIILKTQLKAGILNLGDCVPFGAFSN